MNSLSYQKNYDWVARTLRTSQESDRILTDKLLKSFVNCLEDYERRDVDDERQMSGAVFDTLDEYFGLCGEDKEQVGRILIKIDPTIHQEYRLLNSLNSWYVDKDEDKKKERIQHIIALRDSFLAYEHLGRYGYINFHTRVWQNRTGGWVPNFSSRDFVWEFNREYGKLATIRGSFDIMRLEY